MSTLHPWLQHYPTGVPHTIRPDQYPSLNSLIEECLAGYASRPAYTCMGKTLSFADIDQSSRHCAAWLQSLGFSEGVKIAVMMPNILQYPTLIFGILRAGYTVVNINPLYTPRELIHQLKDSGAQAIIAWDGCGHTIEQVLAQVPIQHIVLTGLGDELGLRGILVNWVVRHIKKMVPAFHLPQALSWDQMINAGAKHTLRPPIVNGNTIAFLQYTGGTTGLSKGAVLSHRNIIANILQSEAWMGPSLRGEMEKIDKANEQLTIITALPLYHIYSLTVNCLLYLKIGGKNHLIVNPRDIGGFVAELRKVRFQMISGVNTLFNALMQHPDFTKIDFSNLRLTSGGGMAVQRAVAERWRALTGSTIIEGYGLSETSPSATCNIVTVKEFSGTIGIPIPSTEVCIRDDAGRDLPYGEIGEICIRGPQVMQGYWQHPEETASAISSDGFFRSGDIGIMDERGFVKIVDRKKDMVLVSGFNVYPNEIEDLMANMPEVLESAVIGVPDSHSGEAVKLFVVRKDPKLTEEQIRQYCEANLTGYKRPKHIEFIDVLPKTNVGKVLRRALRDEAIEKMKKSEMV